MECSLIVLGKLLAQELEKVGDKSLAPLHVLKGMILLEFFMHQLHIICPFNSWDCEATPIANLEEFI